MRGLMGRLQTIVIFIFVKNYNCSKECQCGVAVENLNANRIINGVDTEANEWPWFLYMRIMKGKDEFVCGASLISDSWAISAAHCLFYWDAKQKTLPPLMVRTYDVSLTLGANSLYDYFDLLKQGKVMEVSLFVIPPFNNNHGQGMDIVLIKLKGKVDLRAYPTICLPKPMARPNTTKTVSVGLGTMLPSLDKSKFPKKLQLVEAEIVSGKLCHQKLRAYPFGTMCVGGRKVNRSVCRGDSGGPLMILKAPYIMQYELIGVSSYGLSECVDANGDSAQIFTDVATYMPWILKTMDMHGGSGKMCE